MLLKKIQLKNSDIRIYYVHINSEITNDEYNEYYARLDDARKSRIKRLIKKDDKLRCLYSGLLLREVILLELGIDCKELNFKTNQFWKPYYEEIKEWHFNLSHSGEYVVCGFSKENIGVDVEKIGELHEDIASHFFAEEEYKYIKMSNESEKTEKFYRLWTLKESYIKFIGQGLSIPLDSFCIKEKDGKFYLTYSNYDKEVILYNFKIDEDYMLSITGKM